MNFCVCFVLTCLESIALVSLLCVADSKFAGVNAIFPLIFFCPCISPLQFSCLPKR